MLKIVETCGVCGGSFAVETDSDQTADEAHAAWVARHRDVCNGVERRDA